MKKYDASSFPKSDAHLEKAHSLIPAGAHTYSKGDDCFPEHGPHYLVRGKGCRVWDLDGNEFIDMGMGLTSAGLGHAYEPVVEKARQALELGVNYSLPHPMEAELAGRLVSLYDGAEMVKLGKHGSDATTGAVKLARAFTGRDKVAFCKDQPFFSTNDWFIGATACNAGIPESTRNLICSFGYNDLPSLERLFAEHPEEIACVILQPMEFDEPQPDFLPGVRKLCDEHGALLIFDEVISGFRWHMKGAQHIFGVIPDFTCLGKTIANGFSVSALTGKKAYMELGGTRHRGPKVFLLSTTHGGEIHALAAALATLEEMEKHKVQDHMKEIGEYFIQGFNRLAEQHGIKNFCFARGWGCRPLVETRSHEGKGDLAYRTLFMQEMTYRGILIPQVAPSFGMGKSDMDQVFEALNETFGIYAQALEAKDAKKFLDGRPIKAVFRKSNFED